jgi:hypothetical protein
MSDRPAPTVSQRISRRELLKIAADEGQVVCCNECSRALDRDGRCTACEPRQSDYPGNQNSPSAPELPIRDIALVAEKVRAAGAPRWLLRSIWPWDAYGVLAAEDKAGKTWGILDLGVSVVTGTPWLNHFPVDKPGAALLFVGEGGERAIIRRLAAIIEDRGGNMEDLDGLRICTRAPHLSKREHLEAVRRELEEHPASLVALDPFYLSGRGAKQSDLFDMGSLLEEVQAIAQEAGSALVISHHWNQTGQGPAWKRISGAGPSAWGRVVGSGEVERRAKEADGSSIVQVLWEFIGGEIPDTRFRMRRRVRATDPADLASPLIYSVEVSEDLPDEQDGLTRTQRRVRQALSDGPPGQTYREIGDALAADGQGKPLRRTTILEACKVLAGLNLADSDDEVPVRWWRT